MESWPSARCCSRPTKAGAEQGLLTSLLRLAIVLAGGWIILGLPGAKLDWLYYLVVFAVTAATATLAVVFALRPPSAPPVSG